MDSESVRDSLVAILQRSNPDSAPGSGHKLERGGVIWRRSDGTFFASEVGPPAASQNECTYDLFDPGAIQPPEANLVGIAFFHTHPRVGNEPAYGCPSLPGQPRFSQFPGEPGTIGPAISTPDANGGGSPGDWAKASGTDTPQYTINNAGSVWRLDPGVSVAQRAQNTNRWRWRPAYPGCFLP